jgi:hypothetical protein
MKALAVDVVLRDRVHQGAENARRTERPAARLILAQEEREVFEAWVRSFSGPAA